MRELQNVVKRSAYLVGGITEKFCPYCSTLWDREEGGWRREETGARRGREKKNAEGGEGRG
jgi:hypothetical protein